MSRATELALSVGGIILPNLRGRSGFLLASTELDAFYHAARAEALREAAELIDSEYAGLLGDRAATAVRAMSDREGK